MRFLACTLGRTARRVLRPGATAIVHSQFQTGFNLVTPGRTLVVVTAQPGCAPWVVNVPGLPVEAMCAAASRVRVTEDEALEFVGTGIVVELHAAITWAGGPDVSPAPAAAIRAALRCARLPHFPPGLQGCGLDEADLRRLSAELCRSSEEGAAAAERLVGLGCGLTPAGDDFLTGRLGTLALLGGCGFALDVRGRTTLLGQTLLFHAARGELSEDLHAAIRGLAQAQPDATWPLRRLLGLGHTSGQDMLAGVQLGLELWLAHPLEEMEAGIWRTATSFRSYTSPLSA